MNECCKNEENLELCERRGNNVVMQCRECGRKHYVMEAEAGRLGVCGKGM